MSDTPRTDASEDRVQAFMGGTMVVASWIARDLERDLSATRAKLERAMRVVEAVQKYAVIEYPEGLATAMREWEAGR